jgi:hypothetical protein
MFVCPHVACVRRRRRLEFVHRTPATRHRWLWTSTKACSSFVESRSRNSLASDQRKSISFSSSVFFPLFCLSFYLLLLPQISLAPNFVFTVLIMRLDPDLSSHAFDGNFFFLCHDHRPKWITSTVPIIRLRLSSTTLFQLLFCNSPRSPVIGQVP